MPSTVATTQVCHHCQNGQMNCRYNYFDRGDLQVFAWEHRCPNCGKRETTAYRSDDPGADQRAVNPAVCPYCARSGDEAK